MKALVVHPLRDGRHRLVRLLEYSYGFEQVQAKEDPSELTKLTSRSTLFDYVFVSEDFGDNDISNALEKIRNSPGGSETVFILLSSEATSSSERLGDSLLLGFHGVLCEPLTGERIQQALALSKAVRSQGSHPRLRAASGLYLSNILGTDKESKSEKSTNLWDHVQKNCETYKQLTGESVTNIIVRTFPKPNTLSKSSTYTGASKRVRELFRSAFSKRLKELMQPKE